MPLSSIDIANANGAFMQQSMAAQQNASMIGALGRPPGSGMSFGEHVMGRATNIGSAVGAPMAAIGMGMMGLDPISLAMKGASMGYGGMSMGGLAGAGIGALGGLAVGGGIAAAGGWAANQMMTGIQQQQQLNQMMGQSFTFQNRYGGTGFTGSENRMIGSQIAGMQGFSGPGGSGQMMGFEELSRLASNMGRMGMANGVRDVQEFGKRFKEMMTAVKDIASTMQTSLEEAQKMMSDMRGSGVFGFKNASATSHQIRAAASAGGLAVSEVTGMMGIGSQLARMTGGLGAQGARAGIQAIGQVGAAVQSGVLSEEQIYNVTGLTGAEGRRAFATRGIQQTNDFLRTSQGRYFLASVAGSNGKLNESSIEEYLSGGVGVDDTRRMANQNLNRVGRADFIRNEGRLRASVSERLGVLAPVLSMQQWLGGKGISMDDPRARLYLQRARGMGRDEADAMISMAQNLPEIMEQQRSSLKADRLTETINEARSHSGVEGIKRKLEDAKLSVQKKLQEPARALFQAGFDMIGDFAAKLTGEFQSVQYRQIDELTRSAKGLGAGGASARAQLTGVVGKSAGFQALAAGGRGFGVEGMSNADQFWKFDSAKYEEAGFGIKVHQDAAVEAKLREVQQIGLGAQAGMAGKDKLALVGASLGKRLAGQLSEAAATQGIGQGFSTLTNFEAALKDAAAGGSKEAATVLKKWGTMTAKQKSELATSTYKGAGMDISGSLSAPERMSLSSLRMGSAGEFHEKIGMMMNPNASFLNELSKGSTVGETARAIGAYMDTEEYLTLGKKMLGENADDRAAALKDVNNQLMDLQAVKPDKLSTADRAKRQALAGLKISREIDDAMAAAGVTDPSKLPPGQLDKLVKKYAPFGVTSREDLIGMAKSTGGILAFMDDERYKQFSKDIKETSHARAESLRAIDAKVLDKIKGGAGGELLKLFQKGAEAGEQAEGDRGKGATYLKTQQDITKSISEMSIEEMAAAEKNVSAASPELARQIRAERQGRMRLERGRARGGQAGALQTVAGMLGQDVSHEDLVNAMRGGGKSIGALAQSLIEGSGIKSDDAKKNLNAALQSYLKGEKGGAGKLQGLIEGNAEISEARKKKSMSDAEAANPLQAQANKLLGDMRTDISEMKRMSGLQLDATNKLADKKADAQDH